MGIKEEKEMEEREEGEEEVEVGVRKGSFVSGNGGEGGDVGRKSSFVSSINVGKSGEGVKMDNGVDGVVGDGGRRMVSMVSFSGGKERGSIRWVVKDSNGKEIEGGKNGVKEGKNDDGWKNVKSVNGILVGSVKGRNSVEVVKDVIGDGKVVKNGIGVVVVEGKSGGKFENGNGDI